MRRHSGELGRAGRNQQGLWRIGHSGVLLTTLPLWDALAAQTLWDALAAQTLWDALAERSWTGPAGTQEGWTGPAET